MSNPSLLVLLGMALLSIAIPASGRPFAHNYLSTTAEQGEFEYAQWVTWLDDVEADPDFERYEFRHEFEKGLTDVWQLAFYIPDWRYTRDSDGSDSEIRDLGVETIYQLRDPKESAFGMAIYGEARLGDEVFALEPKLILDKKIDAWTIVWNLALEAEWEGEGYDERKAELGNTFGVGRRLDQHWQLGAEATVAIEYEDFSERQDTTTYLGPTLAYKGHEWWIVGSLLKQLSDISREPDTKFRLILGVEFE